MKYRSPIRVVLLSCLTLGLYDLYWLARTRNELVKTVGARLPGNHWLMLLGSVKIACAALLVWSVYILYIAPAPPVVTAECQRQYTLSLSESSVERPEYPYTTACKEQIALRDITPDHRLIAFGLLPLVALVGLASLSFFYRWLIPYVGAAQAATKNKLHETNLMLMLTLWQARGIAVLQQAYNNPDSMPGFMARDVTASVLHQARIPRYPKLEQVLTVVAIVMVIGLVVLFPVLVARIP
jgi:hypothetical protein